MWSAPEINEYMKIDAPDFDGALYDMKAICRQIADAKIRDIARADFIPEFGSQHIVVTVFGKILGQSYICSSSLNAEIYEKLHKDIKEDKPEVNIESLKNDIIYGISMLRSSTGSNWFNNPEVVWQYHILNKHFGDELPKEIVEVAEDIQK